jgi:hypothetical protein
MNEERAWLWLRQTELIHGHLWHRYYVMVNHDMVTTIKLMTLTEPLWTIGSVVSLLTGIRYGIFNKLPDRIE